MSTTGTGDAGEPKKRHPLDPAIPSPWRDEVPPEPKHPIWRRRRCPECGLEEPQSNSRKRGVRKTQFKCRECGHTWQVVWVG